MANDTDGVLENACRRLAFATPLLDGVEDAIVVHTLDGRIVHANEAWYATRTETPEQLAAMSDFAWVASSMRQRMRALPEALRRDGQVRFESLALDPAGAGFRPVRITARLVEADGEELVVSVARDISERKSADLAIERMAFHDPLTGLANRRLFDDRLRMALAHARRSKEGIAVVFGDLDRLKMINDSLGYAVGDALIRTVGERLGTTVRAGDTLARPAGDEFAMVMLGVATDEAARCVGERLVHALAEPVVIAGHELHVGASFGIALSADGTESPDTLMRRADVAMYSAKQSGGGGFALYDHALAAVASERFALYAELSRAMDRDELEIHYQPLIRICDGEIVGAEALLRWNNTTLGRVSPSDFIPIAEETGIILPIGDWVLQNACSQAREWQEAGMRPIRMSVNVSPRQFLQGTILPSVRKALADSGLSPQHLELEITEQTAMLASPEISHMIADLANDGVRIAIDDFGIGYSSLSNLQDFPIHTLKVDRAFMSHVTDRTESRSIAGTIIGLARILDLNVLAEGVETEAQLDFLREQRCDEMQGFLFSPALPAEEFAGLMGHA